MIIAGIDEAGYGPLLGPLVVGCAAFSVAGDDVEAPPCLWTLLRRAVSARRDRSGRRIHVNDSKAVYSPAAGLRELERSVLSLAAAAGGPIGSFDDFLAATTDDAAALTGIAWYAAIAAERFPLELDSATPLLMANALRSEMHAAEVALPLLRAEVLDERRLNRMIEATRNKASVLFSLGMRHVDRLLREYADGPLLIVLDRQGGREHYGQLLRLMFPDWQLEVLHERESDSRYALRCGPRRAVLHFREKAEAQCLSVALASMLSKYLREGLMGRFNAWWSRLMPELTPTAGYYTDGMRFLRDIEPVRQKMGLTDAELVRAK